MNTKSIGNIGLTHAIFSLTKLGYKISLPLNDSQDYDLVIDSEVDGLQRVEVKTTNQYSDYGVPKVNVKSAGGTNGSIYGHVNASTAHLLYVYHQGQDMSWLIPVSKDLPSSSINLGDKYLDYII